MKQVILFVPDEDDLWFRQKCMSDPKTMNYNAGYDLSFEGYDYDTGCIDFPKSKWKSWYEEKMGNPNFYFAYIMDIDTDEFVGYLNFNKNPETQKATMGIVMYSKYHSKGYMRPAMKKLIEVAKNKGVKTLTDTEKALKVFYDLGFKKVGEYKSTKFKLLENVAQIELNL